MEKSDGIHRRVIVDECVSPGSRLLQRFRQLWAARGPLDYVFLAQKHRGIPDEIVLKNVLGPDTILLTADRVLHNRARLLGLVSCTIDEHGNLTQERLAGVPVPPPPTVSTGGELKSDYAHPANPIATALKAGLTEKSIKHYRTRRRRIRSYFGSESSLAKISLTVGGSNSSRGLICGFFLAIAGNSDRKGIRASEGYALSHAADREGAFCLLHALREVYLLQLEKIPTELFVIPDNAYTLARLLVSGGDSGEGVAAGQALQSLLHGLAKVDLQPCLKGRFYDAMVAKLRQVSQPRCNELVTVEFHRIVENIVRLKSAVSS